MSPQEKFVKNLKTIKDYWASLPDKTPEEVADGVIFSILVMIDGDSGTNDFHSLEIKDKETQERIDCGYLHEVYCGEVKSDV